MQIQMNRKNSIENYQKKIKDKVIIMISMMDQTREEKNLSVLTKLT